MSPRREGSGLKQGTRENGMARHRTWIAAAFLVAAVMVLWRLGGPALTQPDEGRNAEVAREMAESGDWLVPTLEGHAYLDKPAFYFALVAVSLRAFGTNEWAARLPSALFGLALLALVFAFLRSRYDAATGAFAVVILATSPMVFVHARIVIFDIVLAFFVTAAVVLAVEAEEREGRMRVGLHLCGAAAAGLATLVKGPVGFVIPSLVVAAFFCIDRRPAALRRVFAPQNLAVFLAVVLPWFLALVRARPDFLHYGLVEETIERFTKPAFDRGGPPYYYARILPLGLLTWTVLLPGAALAAWRSRSRWSRTDRLLVAWSVTVLVFFTITRTKHPGYILPAVIPLGCLVGRLFGLARLDPTGPAARLAWRASAVLAPLAILLGIALLDSDRLARAAGLEPHDANWLFPAILGARVGIAAMGTLGVLAAVRRDARLAFAGLAVFPLVLLTFGSGAVQAYAERRSALPIASRIARLDGSPEIASVDSYPSGLSFYLGRTLTLLSDDGESLRSNYVMRTLQRSGSYPETIVPASERPAWLASRCGDTYVLSRDHGREYLERIARDRGVALETVAPGWWGTLLPPPTERAPRCKPEFRGQSVMRPEASP